MTNLDLTEIRIAALRSDRRGMHGADLIAAGLIALGTP